MPADGNADEAALLKLAQEGDPDAFGELVGAYRGELRAHCYRMLGSVHDADDALQDALLRAWRSMRTFGELGSLRSWLCSIATNTALDIARHRSRRELPANLGPAGTALAPELPDLPWLEPFPDRWLAHDTGPSPETRYEQRESIELAFVVALQQLPPLQRAVLLLREVLGFSTAEMASQLGTSAQSVNSALQRARSAARDRLPAASQQSALRLLGDQRVRATAERYADAIERADVNTLIGMLTEDATWCMPPQPTWFSGHRAIREFLLRYPLTQRWAHLPTRANGQLAVGGYLHDPRRGGYVPWVIDVLTLRDDKIAAVTAFVTAQALDPPQSATWISGAELFARFGLPATPP